MAASVDLNSARKSLTDELGDSSTIYFQNLASWFKKKTSKEDFDLEARRLLKADAVHLHNEFLLAIIAKCQSISHSMGMSREAALQSAANMSPSKVHRSICINSNSGNSGSAGSKLKRKHPASQKANLQQRFMPVNPIDYAPRITSKPVEEGTTLLGFVARDMLLPDAALIHGRALVCAWEMGLQDVQDVVVKIIIHALEIQLKRILSAVMQKRSGYKLREKHFRFAMGCQGRNPYLRQTAITPDCFVNSEATAVTNSGYHTPSLKPSSDVAEQMAVQELALSDIPPQTRPPISMFDLLEALQLNRSAIPSHTVYALALERVIHGLWHPETAELELEDDKQAAEEQPRPRSVYEDLRTVWL